MKKNLLILNLLITIFSVIPLWNFEASTIDLLSSSSTYTYIIYTGKVCSENNNLELKKTISKNDGIISEQNYLTINENQMETNWEDIESIYCINGIIYICPKGKNHLNKYDSYSNSFSQIIPKEFSSNDNWELKCYQQYDYNLMFIGYLNQSPYFYAYKYNVASNNEDEKWNTKTEFNQVLFDFKWQTSKKEN